MILGIEIAMLIAGVMALATGKFRLGNERVVHPGAARVAGLVLLLPLPLALVFGFVAGLTQAAAGRRFDPKEWQGTLMVAELGLTVVCAALAFSIALLGSSRRREPSEDSRRLEPPTMPRGAEEPIDVFPLGPDERVQPMPSLRPTRRQPPLAVSPARFPAPTRQRKRSVGLILGSWRPVPFSM